MKFKDIDKAVGIWKGKERKFLTLWCHASGIKRVRYDALIKGYMALSEKWIGLYYKEREAQRQRKIELDNSYVYLKCPSMRCRSGFMPETPNNISPTFMVVVFKAYVPGKLLCKSCGRALVTEEELQAEEELMRMGMRFTIK